MNSLILIVGFVSSACCHNGKDRTYSKDTSVTEIHSTFDTLQIINEIKKQFAQINSKEATYDTVKKEVYDESVEGAVLTGYYEKKELKKIAGTYYGETGKTLMQYYFNGDDFFFVYSKEFNYGKPIYIDKSGKVKSTEENRYYFYKGNLIKWLLGNKVVPDNSKEFSEHTSFFKKDFENYKKLFAQ